MSAQTRNGIILIGAMLAVAAAVGIGMVVVGADRGTVGTIADVVFND